MSEQSKNGSSVPVVQVAQDMRPPLAAIESMIALLAETRSQTDQDALIAGLKSAAAHLRNVASDLAKPAASERSQAVVADILQPFFTAVAARAGSVGRNFRHDVAPECGGCIVSDGVGLRQMLEMLADGALGAGQGDLELRVGLQNSSAGGIQFAMLTASVDAAAWHPAAERLAERLGGQCGAETCADRLGHSQWFTVPSIGRRMEPATNQAYRGPCDAPVLIVDGDAASQHMLKTALGNLGHECEVVGSNEQAMAVLQDRIFSAVFVDVSVPGDNGHALVTELRRAGLDLPVVAALTRLLPEEKRRAISAGANWAIEKPVTMHDLRQAMIAIGLRDPMVRQVNAA